MGKVIRSECEVVGQIDLLGIKIQFVFQTIISVMFLTLPSLADLALSEPDMKYEDK